MWKYRSPAIFIAAMAFAVKAAVFGDLIALVAMVTFLTCHYLDRFFSAERVDSKALTQVKAFEEEIKSLRNDISRISMTMGIRGNK